MARMGANKKHCERYTNNKIYEHNKRRNLLKYIKRIRKIKGDPTWLPKLNPVPEYARDILK